MPDGNGCGLHVRAAPKYAMMPHIAIGFFFMAAVNMDRYAAHPNIPVVTRYCRTSL